MKISSEARFMGGAVIAITGAIAAGLFALGSPAAERSRRIDDRRVADIQGITSATDLYWSRHTRLPESLDSLAAESGVQIRRRDPSTSETYGYQPVDSIHYEICATFDRESRESPELARKRANDLWLHGAGRHCFRFQAQEIERNDR